MSTVERTANEKPIAWLLGDSSHLELRDAAELLHGTAQLSVFGSAAEALQSHSPVSGAPEIIVIAATRPGSVMERDILRLRRAVPLSGIILLLGTWCEGETRTGRPVAGVGRYFWYEFPQWWSRQIDLRSAGLCPDWARTDDPGLRTVDSGITTQSRRPGIIATHGPVVLAMSCRESADALADVLRDAGFATIWQRAGQPLPECRGASAGIWEGRQLDVQETARLATFCRRLSGNAMPIIALVDFPRWDSCQRARQVGVTTVLGKPWRNSDLVIALECAIEDVSPIGRTTAARAA